MKYWHAVQKQVTFFEHLALLLTSYESVVFLHPEEENKDFLLVVLMLLSSLDFLKRNLCVCLHEDLLLLQFLLLVCLPRCLTFCHHLCLIGVLVCHDFIPLLEGYISSLKYWVIFVAVETDDGFPLPVCPLPLLLPACWRRPHFFFRCRCSIALLNKNHSWVS